MKLTTKFVLSGWEKKYFKILLTELSNGVRNKANYIYLLLCAGLNGAWVRPKHARGKDGHCTNIEVCVTLFSGRAGGFQMGFWRNWGEGLHIICGYQTLQSN